MTPEELSKLPRYDYYANVKAAHPDASDQLCSAFAASMQGKLYGPQETLDAFGWFWEGWGRSSAARTPLPEAALFAPPTQDEIAAYRDLFRLELDKRMDTKHPSFSPSTEAHEIALRAFVERRRSPPLEKNRG